MALARAAVPVLAILVFAGLVVAILASAGDTWGYDFQAYAQAAHRLLDGQPLYDSNVDLAGGFAIYLYPPPFAVAFIPFALLGDQVGLYAWTAFLIGCTVAAVALLPVSAPLRWGMLLLAGLSWPVLYSIKLGQVGPILLLLFVLGWRWLDRPVGLGASIGVGTVIKVQPALLGIWALLTGRPRAALVAAAVVIVAVVVTLPFVGLTAWSDYASLLSTVSEPVTTPHNFTVGAVLYQAGVSAETATIIQWGVVVATLAAVLVAALRLDAEASYMVAVVATQLVSPLLWDHYAVVLLLPAAWLLARGAWWALAIPIATSLPLVPFVPAAVYPIVFIISLLGPFTVRQSTAQAAVQPAQA
jgi:alpha-1,2-mannosyltransferase